MAVLSFCVPTNTHAETIFYIKWEECINSSEYGYLEEEVIKA